MASTSRKLTEEQQAVIDHDGGHLQVIACAGSGKTETIAHRIARLVAEGAPAASIVAFTFTERAAEEMKQRIGLRVEEISGVAVRDALTTMFVGTIHGYCLRMLQEHVPRFAAFDVADEHQFVALVHREHRRLGLERLGVDGQWHTISVFLRNVDAVENELISASDLGRDAFAECYAGLLRTLEEYRLLSFGRLTAEAVKALADPVVLQAVHGPLRWLFVDEFQDVNPAQARLIDLLAQPPLRLCVVGDDDQAVYQWRGSDAGIIRGFRRRYRARTLPISENFRARPVIVVAAENFAAATIRPRLPKKMLPARTASRGPELHAWQADTPETEAAAIANTISALVAQGWRRRDIAILLRSVSTSSGPLLGALRTRNIQVRCAGRTGLFLHPEAEAVGRVYALLGGFDWQPGRFAAREALTTDDVADGLRRSFDLATSDRNRLRNLLRQWAAELATGDRPNLMRDYYRLLRALGVHRLDPADQDEALRLGVLGRFSELLADFEHMRLRARLVNDEATSTTRRAASANATWLHRNLAAYVIHYAADSYGDFAGEERDDQDAVHLSTIPQAKGLQWPIVFLPCLVASRFPSRNTGRGEEWLLGPGCFSKELRLRYEGDESDERRLFYVALTRARETAYLSAFQRMKRRVRPSPFLQDVAGPAALPGPPLPLPVAPTGVPAGGPEEGVVASFSDLALYDDCGYGFRLRAVMGYQPPLVAELGHGRAVHHVLRRLAEEVQRTGRLPDTAEAARLVDREFHLPFANAAAFREMRRDAGRKVAEYLRRHGDDLLRVWQVERPVETRVEGGTVTGRADVILDREGGLPGRMAIVDYKTAKDPSADARFAFQLALYTAGTRAEGIDVTAAWLHELGGARTAVPVGAAEVGEAVARAGRLIAGIRGGRFEPTRERSRCANCDVRPVCRQARGGRSK